MNFNQVGELDLAAQTFAADFFVWFRYEGGETLPFTPTFTNAVDPGLELGDPQKLSQSFGQTYALYRVNGEFKGQFAFNKFPFDTQQLPIMLQPSDAPSSRVSFVVDAAVLSEQQEQRLASGVNPTESMIEFRTGKPMKSTSSPRASARPRAWETRPQSSGQPESPTRSLWVTLRSAGTFHHS